MMESKKILYAASSMRHINNFHLDYIKALRDMGHTVKVMASGEGADFDIPFEKKLFSPKNTACRKKIREIIRSEGFDVIISHHPLIFRPLSAVSSDNHISRKVIKLLTNGVSVFSFHTRADKVSGGVNDLLCDIIGISDAKPFGEGLMGRVGTVDELSLEDFAYRLKELLSADGIRFADGYNTVSRVAVLGGDGKDFVKAAIEAGADTYVSGRISYNLMEEAAEMGINLVEAGHYFTEQPVCSFFYNVIKSADPSLDVETTSSNLIKLI